MNKCIKCNKELSGRKEYCNSCYLKEWRNKNKGHVKEYYGKENTQRNIKS